MELQIIQNKIYEIRGQKVMLDFDLAELYGTETRLLKRAVRPVGYPNLGYPNIILVLTLHLRLRNRG